MKKFLKVFTLIIVVISIMSLLGAGSYYFTITKNIVLSENSLGLNSTSVNIYNLNNQLINKSEYTDSYINFVDIPQNLINAFISIEDKRFYKHNGIDYYRIIGATVNNIKAMSIKEGASTISQQLIKNTHLSGEKSINRKIQEAKLSRDLEKNHTKDEIIEMYLNAIYFGSGIYGVETAAQRFLNKNCKDLTLSECALLAGIVKNPSKYSPVNNYENSINRRNIVLSQMLEQNYIKPSEEQLAKDENINITFMPVNNSPIKPYVKNVLRQASIVLNMNTNDIIAQNYSIYTYLDDRVQNNLADKIYNGDYYLENDKGMLPDGMGIIVDNYSSGIIAFCSSSPYTAYDIKRQPGSAIKPIAVYAPALEYGIISPATHILDEKTSFGNYNPSNYNDKYYGWVSARDALARSLNIPAVKVLSYIGQDKALNFISQLGFDIKNEDAGLALALGGTHNGVNMLQMASAYSSIASNGTYNDISFIKEIKDSYGNLIYSHNLINKQVITKENSYLLTNMLESVASYGTANKLSILNYPVSAKTGTVASSDKNYNSDAWSMSYTKEHTVGIWMGNTSNNSDKMLSKSVTGGGYPTMIARDVYYNLYYNKYPEQFTCPSGVKYVEIDKISLEKDHTLKLASTFTPEKYRIKDIFNINNIPKEISDYFTAPNVENFNIEINDNQALIKFDTQEYVTYDIYRIINSEKELIHTVTSKGEEYEFIDEIEDKSMFISYVIYPKIIIEDIDIIGLPSRTITIYNIDY